MSLVPGFFGKLPSRGDFVSRRLPSDLVSAWDDWLQRSLAASQAALGAAWLDVYLTSPIWRFAAAPGVCGASGLFGAFMPSVDRVGRYFPLTAAVPCGEDAASVIGLALDLDDWHVEVESLLLATLSDTPLDLEAFDERLCNLPVRSSPAATNLDGLRTAVRTPGERSTLRWCCELTGDVPIRQAMLSQVGAILSGCFGPCSIWWTQGSERVAPCLLIASGLPEPEAFAAMLDGQWKERGWTCGALSRPSVGRAALSARSAGRTDVGKSRNRNEDSFARRDESGVWIVADGLGGHQAGDTASRMVTSVIDQLGEPAQLTERVDGFVQALRLVNGCLRVLADRDGTVSLAASTVAALLICGDAAAWVWVGDSRIYRSREGELEQLSRDHSEEAGDGHHNRAVTRAVGGSIDLDVELASSDVQAGDRYLLCTDGLYGELSAEQIAAALSRSEPELACAELVAAALAGEARDNLTAVVVYVSSSHDGLDGHAADR